MTNKMKRLTALMLALVMIYSCLPMNVLAEATSGVAGGYSIQRSVSYPTLQNGTVVEVEKGKTVTWYIYTNNSEQMKVDNANIASVEKGSVLSDMVHPSINWMNLYAVNITGNQALCL